MNPRATADAATTAGAIAGSLVVIALLPFAAGQSFVPTLSLGLLVAVAGMGGLLVMLAAASAMSAERRRMPAILDAALLWAGCGLALCGAMGAVVATAESMQLDSVVLAQEYTALFVLRQPVAALVYVVAVALAGRRAALGAVFGAPSPARTVASWLLIVAMSGLGATLFAGGFYGERLAAPAWLGIKTLAVLALIAGGRAGSMRLRSGTVLRIAWACAGIGLVNLAVAFALAMR